VGRGLDLENVVAIPEDESLEVMVEVGVGSSFVEQDSHRRMMS